MDSSHFEYRTCVGQKDVWVEEVDISVDDYVDLLGAVVVRNKGQRPDTIVLCTRIIGDTYFLCVET